MLDKFFTIRSSYGKGGEDSSYNKGSRDRDWRREPYGKGDGAYIVAGIIVVIHYLGCGETPPLHNFYDTNFRFIETTCRSRTSDKCPTCDRWFR